MLSKLPNYQADNDYTSILKLKQGRYT